MTEPREILDFWFEDCDPEQWFSKDPVFDQTIRDRFGAAYAEAMAGKLDHWEHDAQFSLALIVLLDQFPRNMFRGTARMYEADAKALALAKRVVGSDAEKALSEDRRRFLYLPLEHSEDLSDQRHCLALMTTLEDQRSAEYAHRHLVIIERFGRFPHRNDILGRQSTPEEIVFLTEPDSSF